MNASTLQAAQIINPPPGFWENYGPSITLGIVAVLVIGGGVWALLASGPEWEAPFGLLLTGMFLIGGDIGVGIYAVSADGPSVNKPAVTALIERNYALTSVKVTGEDLDVERLCQAVSLDSPEFEGAADGQKVTFRIGIADCESPDPEIIITETSGVAIDVNDLGGKQ